MKKIHFEREVNYKGHNLFVDGYKNDDGTKIVQVFLLGTTIEISNSLTCEHYDELLKLIK